MYSTHLPVVRTIEGAADQRSDVGRAYQSMPPDLPDDLHMVIS
jgi:hypothetical protein